MLIGRYFANQASTVEVQQRPQPPIFVLQALAALNSCMAGRGVADVAYETAKGAIGESVNAALIVAIAALGLKTELRDLMIIGWRRIAVFLIGAAFIALFCAAGLWWRSACCAST